MKKLCKCFLQIVDFIKENVKHISHVIGLRKDDIELILNDVQAKIETNQITSSELKRYIVKLTKHSRSLRNKLFNADEKSVRYVEYRRNLKQLHKILDVLDAFESIDERTKLLAMISKAGTIQISIVREKNIQTEIAEDLPIEKNNALVEKAIDDSGVITGFINKLPKIFSIIDLNRFMGFNDKVAIFDHPRKLIRQLNIVDSARINQLFKCVSPQKAIYLRFNVGGSDISKYKVGPMDYYNYLSLLVSYHHSYDPNTILNYYIESKKPDYRLKKNNDRPFVDYLGKPTEHLYYDESLFTVSAIDETVNINQINAKLKNKKSLVEERISHQLRIYSLWDFTYVCNALAFGSTGIVVNTLLDDYIKTRISEIRFKQIIHVKQARLGRIMSRISSFYSHTTFSLKTDGSDISDIVFDKIGLIRLEKSVYETSDINWRSANLLNAQNYNRYGLLFSFINLFILIASYGLIAKVAISCTASNYGDLMKDLFTDSPKIPVVLTVAAVPILAYIGIVIFEYIHSYKFPVNIARLDKFKVLKGDKILKNTYLE